MEDVAAWQHRRFPAALDASLEPSSRVYSDSAAAAAAAAATHTAAIKNNINATVRGREVDAADCALPAESGQGLTRRRPAPSVRAHREVGRRTKVKQPGFPGDVHLKSAKVKLYVQ